MHWIKTLFSIDLRSIALFRVALALLILFDLFLRSFNMVDFYTDEGVLPRRYWALVTHRWYLSLHAASGELWWQIFLFIIAAVFACALLVGYRSKLMAGFSLIMLMSLMNRNGLVLQGGDQLLVVMCFWSLFLPIGARWSIDAALQPELRANPNLQRFSASNPQSYFSIATVAVIFQVLYLYFFTALLKTGAAWRVRFDAAFYAVSLQHFATPVAVFFRQFPALLKFATLYVLTVEFLAPLLVLLPLPRHLSRILGLTIIVVLLILGLYLWPWTPMVKHQMLWAMIVPLLLLLPLRWPWTRLVGLLMLASLHVAFLFMLHIGLFPLIDFMSLTLLIPSIVWVWLARRQRRNNAERIVFYYDEDCGFCLKMCLILREFLLPDSVKILPAQAYPDMHALMERENSWVVTDASGRPHVHWHAMQLLFIQSWPFKPIGWLMKLSPLMRLGNFVYRWVATNRNSMGEFTARWLPYRPLKLRPTLPGQILAALFFYIITVFNVTGLPGFGDYRPVHVDYMSRILRIDQKWDMFAPFPLTVSLYPRVTGKLRNGDKVNLYELTSSEPGWQPAEDMYSLFENYRWRKYLGRVDGHSNNTVRRAYGDYQCRLWNHSSRPRDQQLAIFDIHFDKWRTNTTGDAKVKNSRMVWQHWCFKEFAPKK